MQPPTRKQLWPSIEARVPLKKKWPYETKNKIIPFKEEPSMPYLGQPSDYEYHECWYMCTDSECRHTVDDLVLGKTSGGNKMDVICLSLFFLIS